MGKLEYPEKTINILQVTDKVDHIIVVSSKTKRPQGGKRTFIFFYTWSVYCLFCMSFFTKQNHQNVPCSHHHMAEKLLTALNNYDLFAHCIEII
jgi:hypothetical protein